MVAPQRASREAGRAAAIKRISGQRTRDGRLCRKSEVTRACSTLNRCGREPTYA